MSQKSREMKFKEGGFGNVEKLRFSNLSIYSKSKVGAENG